MPGAAGSRGHGPRGRENRMTQEKAKTNQVVLTIKVLLIAGGTIGALAMLDTFVVK